MNRLQKKILLIFFIILHNSIHLMHEMIIPNKKDVRPENNSTHHENLSSHKNFQNIPESVRYQISIDPMKVNQEKNSKTSNAKTTLERENKSVEPNMQPKNFKPNEKTTGNSIILDKKINKLETSKISNDLLDAPNYYHPEQMEAPLEAYIKKIDDQLTTKFPFIKNILPQNFFRYFSIMYIIDQSAAYIGFNKIKLNQISLDNIDWHTPFTSSIQKFAAGLSELNTVFKTTKSLSYTPLFKDNKSMSTTMENYIIELKKDPLFTNQEPIILQEYVTAVLKESNSGKSGWFFGSYPILEPKDVLLFIPNKKEVWPIEKNNEGDYIGQPSPSQKIYAMMQAIYDIPHQVKNITSKEIQLSRYEQGRAAITNIPTQITSYIKSSAYDFAMSQLKQQISPQLYDSISLIFQSQDPIDTGKKIVLQEVLNRDRNIIQGKPFFDQQDLEILLQIAQKETSHLVNTTGPFIIEGLKNKNSNYSSERPPLLNKEAQDIFDEITAVALDKGAEILMKTLFTPDEIAQIENSVRNKEIVMEQEKSKQFSENMIENYLKLKKYNNEEQLIKQSFNRLSRSHITLYFIDSFQASAQKIKKSPEHLKTFISSIISNFSKIKNLTPKEENILQEEFAQETDSLLKNKESWVHAKASDFHIKFSVWMENFITKIYDLFGKINPKNLNSFDFGSEENPLTPNVDLIWNEKEVDPAKKVTSILVTYKDTTMQFDLKNNNIIFDPTTGTYTITTELYNQAKPKSVIESISNTIYDNIVQGIVIKPLIKSSQGNIKAQTEVEALNNVLTTQGENKEGILIVNYNPSNKKLTTTVTQKNQSGLIHTTEKEYATSTQKILSQKIIISPKSSPGILASADTYTPDIIIEDLSPEIVDSTKKGLSFKAEYTNPQTGEVFIFNAKPENIFLDQFGTYKTSGTLQTTKEMPSVPDGTEGQIIKIMQKILPPLNIKTYRSLISNFRSSWTGARIAQQYPELYNAAETWMLNNYEIGVDSIEIEYNPTHNIVATKIFSTMAVGQAQAKKSLYLLN